MDPKKNNVPSVAVNIHQGAFTVTVSSADKGCSATQMSFSSTKDNRYDLRKIFFMSNGFYTDSRPKAR